MGELVQLRTAEPDPFDTLATLETVAESLLHVRRFYGDTARERDRLIRRLAAGVVASGPRRGEPLSVRGRLALARRLATEAVRAERDRAELVRLEATFGELLARLPDGCLPGERARYALADPLAVRVET